MSKLDEIKARCEAATPGPWNVAEWDDCPAIHFEILDASGDYDHQFFVPQDQHYHTGPLADCNFIAHARQDVPLLIRALELAAEERYKYLRLLGSVSDRKKAIHIHGIISSWLSQAAADLDHPGDA